MSRETPYHSTHSHNKHLSTEELVIPADFEPPMPGQCPIEGCNTKVKPCSIHPVSWDASSKRVLALSVSECASNQKQCELAKHILESHSVQTFGSHDWVCPIPRMTDGTPCGLRSSRKSNLSSHLTSKHCPTNVHYFCVQCASFAPQYAKELNELCQEPNNMQRNGWEKGTFSTTENAKKHFLNTHAEE